MKQLILALLFFPLSLHARLQGKALLDSLLHEASLNKKQDTARVVLLKEISFEYASIKPDEGLKYGTDALKLAEQLGWKTGQISAFNSLFVNYFAKADYSSALVYGTRGLEISEKIGDKKHISTFLGNIAMIYTNEGDYTKSLELQDRKSVV